MTIAHVYCFHLDVMTIVDQNEVIEGETNGSNSGIEKAQTCYYPAEYPGAEIIDLTSKSTSPWVQLSPFFPHGDIPIPNSDKMGQSAEGIWQGLKVFENEEIDHEKWEITNMRGIKRSTGRRGKVRGHQFGLNSMDILPYLEARKKIYLPTYFWVLENRLTEELEQLKELATKGDLVLLDYETNADLDDLSKPLSHASLVMCWLREKHGLQ
eukprot:CFRG7780T1